MNKLRKIGGVLFVSVLACLATGCSQPRQSAPTAPSEPVTLPIRVVCTTNIVKDLVRQIGGDRVQVTAIMDGPGVDPHVYTPSPQDTNAVTAADVVVYSGLHLEGQFDQALESLKHRGIPVICLTDSLTSEHPGRLLQSGQGTADPHVWFDPDLWASCGYWFAAGMTEYDAAGAEHYAANAAEFATDMQQTKQECTELLHTIDRQRRVLVTAHDAFEYFARAFDFEVQGVQGISTDSEPGLRRINELIDRLVRNGITAVFTEQSVSDKNIQALVAGCQARGHVLVIGGRLFSDTVGAAGTPEETLRGALLHNVREIVAALRTPPVSQTSAQDQTSVKDGGDGV
ncbi:MAG: zinc ABC transporter substrate-binding protein [Planctomycetaceae bacterium]